jgi:hypothetical protein
MPGICSHATGGPFQCCGPRPGCRDQDLSNETKIKTKTLGSETKTKTLGSKTKTFLSRPRPKQRLLLLCKWDWVGGLELE